LDIALAQFGKCLEATTWNSKKVSICNEKEIERASARGEQGRTRSILGEGMKSMFVACPACYTVLDRVGE
jgi:hypothetical protein